MQTDKDALLTTAEVALLLRVSVSTLERWRRTGRPALEYVRVGRGVRYRRGDVMKMLARENRVER